MMVSRCALIVSGVLMYNLKLYQSEDSCAHRVDISVGPVIMLTVEPDLF